MEKVKVQVLISEGVTLPKYETSGIAIFIPVGTNTLSNDPKTIGSKLLLWLTFPKDTGL